MYKEKGGGDKNSISRAWKLGSSYRASEPHQSRQTKWVEASALDLPIFLAEDMHRRRQHMSSSYSRADTIPAEALRQRGKQKLLDSLDVILSPPFAPPALPSFLPFPADLSWGSKSDNHLEAGVREWRGESEGVGEGKRHGILLQF